MHNPRDMLGIFHRPTAPWQNLREGNPGGRHFSMCWYKLEAVCCHGPQQEAKPAILLRVLGEHSLGAQLALVP